MLSIVPAELKLKQMWPGKGRACLWLDAKGTREQVRVSATAGASQTRAEAPLKTAAGVLQVQNLIGRALTNVVRNGEM